MLMASDVPVCRLLSAGAGIVDPTGISSEPAPSLAAAENRVVVTSAKFGARATPSAVPDPFDAADSGPVVAIANDVTGKVSSTNGLNRGPIVSDASEKRGRDWGRTQSTSRKCAVGAVGRRQYTEKIDADDWVAKNGKRIGAEPWLLFTTKEENKTRHRRRSRRSSK